MENNSNEIYAGIMHSDIGDYHLYLLLDMASRLNWNEATVRATSLGGYLPSTDEQTLLFSKCKSHFKEGFYWSSTLYARDPYYAYVMRFTDGASANFPKLHEYQIAVVRREFVTKEDRMKNKPSVPQTPLTSKMSEEALRDAFAGKAMQALLAKPNTLRGSDLAIAAYSIADAMMKERIK